MVARAALLLLAEQLLNTAWNFLLGLLVARLGGVEIFGTYSTTMAVYFFLAGPIGAMTTAISSVDVARLHRSRASYLIAAGRTGERIVAVIQPVAVAVIVAQGVHFDISNPTLAIVVGVLYVSSSFFTDLWRRNLALSHHRKFLVAASTVRLGALMVVACLSLLYFDAKRAAALIVIAAALITVVYLIALRTRAVEQSRLTLLRRISLGRQIRFGSWGALSALVMYGLDQGLMIFVGLIGKSDIAAALRSASYLFGLMNPVMLVFDLIVPSMISRWLGRQPRLVQILPLLLAGAVLGAALGLSISLISAFLWLPFLGAAYTTFVPLTYWFGAAFAFMFVRSIMTPFLKTRTPRALFVSSLLGTLIGLLTATSAPVLDAVAICRALLSSAIVLSSTSFFILLWEYSWKANRRADRA